MEKITIELNWDGAKNFDIDEVINKAWSELSKCKRVDVITKYGRTCYGDL